jgi:AraC-like DNA-binding protein
MSMIYKARNTELISAGSKHSEVPAIPPNLNGLDSHPLTPISRIETPGPPDWRVRRIVLFIDAEDGKVGPDMADICEKLDLGISAEYAVKLFKKHTGIGFRDYAAHRRLWKAANQLAETSLSIKVIAADLGYNSPQDFSRRFKFQYQVKPTEYRRRQHH